MNVGYPDVWLFLEDISSLCGATELKKSNVAFFKKKIGGHESFFGTIDTNVFNFWWWMIPEDNILTNVYTSNWLSLRTVQYEEH